MVRYSVKKGYYGMQQQTPIHPGSAEEKAIENCLSIIRGCQLPDGAFCMMKERPGAAIWIPPYFANYAALALVASSCWKRNIEDVLRVRDWLNWCAVHQAKAGYFPDFVGNPTDYKISTMVVDAWDSSAALFLLVLERYLRAGGFTNADLAIAAQKALACIQATTDKTDGLTWAKPDYKIKYLEDNIEVYAGLMAGATYFLGEGDKVRAAEAKKQAEQIAKKLPRFWSGGKRRYSVAMHKDDVLEDGQKLEAYPQGQAQLFGIAFVKPQPGAWQTALTFNPDDSDRQAALGSERWMIAAARVGGTETKRWRQRATQTALKFTPGTVFIYRPALTVLGLLEGADWMPSIAAPFKLT